MNQEKFNLTWHSYTDHLKEMLHDMMSSNELTDVTLVSEDKKHFKAHKVVLSACSPVFKSIIGDSIMSNSTIYLRGIQSLEIESILQFIYLGEATLYQERKNEFLDVAKSLQVKEISKDIEIPEKDDVIETQEYAHDIEITTNETKQEHNRENIPQKDRRLKKCNENKYPCDKCNYIASNVSDLKKHVKSIHEGVKYPCNQCSSKFTDQSSLRQHIRSIHEGVHYACDQCSSKFTKMFKLKQHLKSKHS